MKLKILTLNINKLILDVSKESVFDYLNSINADIKVLQECPFDIEHNISILYKGDKSKKRNYTGLISELYHINDEKSLSSKIISIYHKNELPEINILCVHLTESDLPDLKSLQNIDIHKDHHIICGDLNVGKIGSELPHNSLGAPFYLRIINDKEYCDLWEYCLENDKAFFIDFLGKKKKADKSVFYRTFSQQKENDFILCKKAIAEKTTEMLIDYRTLSFTDHCAVIAEFEV